MRSLADIVFTPVSSKPRGALHEARLWAQAQCCNDEAVSDALNAGDEAVAILRSLGMDDEGMRAALLLPLLSAEASASGDIEDKIADRFGAPTLELMQRAARMRQLSALSRHGAANADPNADEENLRRMLIAMVDDARVVLIELARHLARLHRAKNDARETQIAIAHATIEVYAPLANRLGVRQLKWQLEDCALRFLHPREYHDLATRLRERRADRELYIGAFIDELKTALRDANIKGEVHGRPKHLYSIWKKMRRKGLAFEGLHDLHAVRILVHSVDDCYGALALVHAKWRRLPHELDDYIAVPKENGYRSIHTVIEGPHERIVEVQIRTFEMHRHSELGVAAHWRYKESVRADGAIDDKVRRLRQLLEWKAEVQYGAAVDDDASPNSGVEHTDDRVYAFTPKGAVIDLPRGATPIDFAYAIHTEVGHSIRGARVNGKMVPLSHKLATGDQVQIQTAAGGHPSRDWLRRDYARTRRARARIAHWFKRADYAQHLADGRAMLERELPRLGLSDLSYDKIARASPFNKTDDLLAALGANDYKLSRALAPFRRQARAASPKSSRASSSAPAPVADALEVSGVDNLLTRMAQCCGPIPGDAIVGFVTVGRGVSIHRRDCRNIKRLDDDRRARLIEVQWGGGASKSSSPVEIVLRAYHRSNLLNEITDYLKAQGVAVRKLTMETDADQGAQIHLTLDIPDIAMLDRVQNGLRRMPDVHRVRRARMG